MYNQVQPHAQLQLFLKGFGTGFKESMRNIRSREAWWP